MSQHSRDQASTIAVSEAGNKHGVWGSGGDRVSLRRALCGERDVDRDINHLLPSQKRIHPMLITLRTPAQHIIVRPQHAGRATHIRMDGFLPSMPQIASPIPNPPSIDPTAMAMSVAPFLLLPLFLLVANVLVGLIFDASTSPEEDRKMAERGSATRDVKQSNSPSSMSSGGGLLDGLFGGATPEPPSLNGLFGGGAGDFPSPAPGPPASGGFFGNKGGGFLGDDAPLPPPPQQQPPLPPPPQQQPPVPVPPPPPTTNYAQEAAEEARRLAAERRVREEQESAAAAKAAQEAAAAQQAQEAAQAAAAAEAAAAQAAAAEAAAAKTAAAESAPVPKPPPPPPPLADEAKAEAKAEAKSAKERMAELKALLDDGLVTAEEFEAGRQRILDTL